MFLCVIFLTRNCFLKCYSSRAPIGSLAPVTADLVTHFTIIDSRGISPTQVLIRRKKCLKIAVLTIIANTTNFDYFYVTILVQSVREDFKKKIFSVHTVGPLFCNFRTQESYKIRGLLQNKWYTAKYVPLIL